MLVMSIDLYNSAFLNKNIALISSDLFNIDYLCHTKFCRNSSLDYYSNLYTVITPVLYFLLTQYFKSYVQWSRNPGYKNHIDINQKSLYQFPKFLKMIVLKN